MTFYTSRPTKGAYVAGRDPNIDQVMRGWQNRYCTFQEARICVTTFNVNGRTAPTVLPGWFPDENCDIYAVGLQEMDLSVGTYIIDNTRKMEEWMECIQSSLPGASAGAYEKISSVRMVGIFLVLFRWRKSTVRYSNISGMFIATGLSVLINKLGNKGGVALSMKLNDTTVCFVNSHFAAGNNELERRNQDYRDIVQKQFDNGLSTIDHEVVFWFGDLNYRLNTEFSGLNNDQVRAIASSESHGQLLRYCQLRDQMSKGAVFEKFNEMPQFKFRPTYKYDVGTCIWDTSEKGRVPAWTDRILYWKLDENVAVEQMTLESVENICISDHKPVRSLFRVKLASIDQDKANGLYDEAIRESDRLINENLPKVELSQTEVDFGEVKYLEPKTVLIEVRNVGNSQVRFIFNAKPQTNDAICANWLQVTPPHYLIQKGNSTKISLTVSIDTNITRELHVQGRSPVLEDNLVLRLENGRDHFIPVSAKYQPRVFGVSLDELLANRTHNLIDFIYRLVNALRVRGVDTLKLSESAENLDFIVVRNALESGHPKDLALLKVPTLALYSALIRLLDTLTDPIIPSGMDGFVHYEFVRAKSNAVQLWSVVASTLPPANGAVLEYVVLMLHEFISQKMAIREQLPVWAEKLFRYPSQMRHVLTSAPDARVIALQTLCEYRRDAVMF